MSKPMPRKLSISNFSEMTAISVSTLRDWNKRGLSKEIGEPGANGHWQYNKTDVLKVYFASLLNGNGINWKVALFAGNVLGKSFEAQMLRSDEYTTEHNKFAFYGLEASDTQHYGSGKTADEAMANADRNAGQYTLLGIAALVVDLDKLVQLLPAGFDIEASN